MAKLFPLGFLIVALGIGSLAGSRTLLVASVAYFLTGTGRMVIEVAATTMYQKAVPDGLRGRVFALRHMVTHSVILGANQVAGIFTDAASIIPVLVVAAAIQLASSPLSAIMLAKSRRWLEEAHQPTAESRL